MEAFGVIHTEKNYINPEILVDGRPRSEVLFDRIADEIGRQLELGRRVYFMADRAESADSELIYDGIRQYSDKMVFVAPGEVMPVQWLKTKELWLKDGVERGELAGVSYFQCVRDFYLFLSGGVDKNDAYLRWAQELLGWSEGKFEDTVSKSIDVSVREELTEKPFMFLGKEILRFLR